MVACRKCYLAGRKMKLILPCWGPQGFSLVRIIWSKRVRSSSLLCSREPPLDLIFNRDNITKYIPFVSQPNQCTSSPSLKIYKNPSNHSPNHTPPHVRWHTCRQQYTFFELYTYAQLHNIHYMDLSTTKNNITGRSQSDGL